VEVLEKILQGERQKKIASTHSMKAYRGSGFIAPLIPKIGTSGQLDVSAAFHFGKGMAVSFE
jgi:hypothetical protein